jgi:hypothetical protein
MQEHVLNRIPEMGSWTAMGNGHAGLQHHLH